MLARATQRRLSKGYGLAGRSASRAYGASASSAFST
jgi:hypothetical protein